MDEHVIEALGKTRVKIRHGKVVEVGEPKISYCPIFDRYRDIKKLTSEEVKKNIEFRIENFGMCTPIRTLRMDDFLSFGISETMGTLIEEKLIDCAVTVCDGCGTVIIREPEVIQGVGGRVSAIVSTSPIENIIERIGREKILNPEKATINQVEGVLKAIDMGYKKIAVTIVSAADAEKLRQIEEQNKDVKIYIFAVHVSGISMEETKILFKNADIITACASKYVRQLGIQRGVFHAGESIPIFGITEAGEKFLKLRIEKIGGLKHKKNAKIPDPLI